MGVSENRPIACMHSAANVERLAEPPRKAKAPTILASRKAKATGNPGAMAKQTMPSINAIATGHAMSHIPLVGV